MKINKLFPYILTLVIAILLGVHLQRTQEFLFFFREKFMVFYNDWDIIFSRYHGVGGIGLGISHWLSQFFINNYVGATVTALIGAISALALWGSMPKNMRNIMLLPLCIVPVIFQCDALFDVYYAYQGYVAFFLFTLFALAYRIVGDRCENHNIRIATASCLCLLLFYVGGSVGFLLSIYLFVVELVDNPRSSWKYLLPIALILIASAFCVTKAYLSLYRYALSNAAYYEPIIEPSNFFHTSWILVGLIAFVAPLLQMLQKKIKYIFEVTCAIVFVVLISLFAINSANRNEQKMYAMIAMDHYINTGQTKELLQSKYSDSSNFIMMNRVNYALSKEGRLLDDFYHYHQLAPNSIMNDLKDLSLDVEITSTLSEIYYQMDNIASADEKAFNSYEGLRYGSPNNLQMLVKTSLVFGRYRQAEKYIKMLEETTYYKDWASAQRKYLYDDAAVEADPEYGSKRKSLPSKDSRYFVQAYGPYADLLETVRTNPQATAARDYAIAYLLLTNNIPHINSFMEEFYGSDAMPIVPRRLQEAFLAANESDLERCRAYGVEESVINDYKELKKTLIQARNNGDNAQTYLRQWRYTYWYYLLITSPNLAKMREQLRQQEEAQKNNLPELS